MKLKVWYISSLLLPLIFPACMLGILALIENNNLSFPGISIIKALSLWFGFQLWFEGVPYAIFYISFFLWAITKDVSSIRKSLMFLPLIFVLVNMIIFKFYLAFKHGGFNTHALPLEEYDLWIAFFVLVFGYFYIFLIRFLTWALHQAKIIKA